MDDELELGNSESVLEIVRERETWEQPIHFLLSALAGSIGLINVLTFPAVVASNGGGAFLIIYFVVLFVVGLPLFHLEICLAQFTSYNQVSFWNVCPAFRGIGVAAVILNCLFLPAYVVAMSYSAIYILNSFKSPFPWENNSEQHFLVEVLQIQSTEDFLEGKGLGGYPITHIALSTTFCWILLWLMQVRGICAVGKVGYITAVVPYVLILIITIKVLALENASLGVFYLFTPDFSKLTSLSTWITAAEICCFSLGPGLGVAIPFASYNFFYHNIVRDSTLVAILDFTLSLLASVCVFGSLGHLGSRSNETVDELAKRAGDTLSYVTFPKVVVFMGNYPIPQAFSLFFYTTLLLLALGSAHAIMSVCTVAISDAFNITKFSIVASISCAIGFLLSLVFTTPGGKYFNGVLNYYAGENIVLFIALLEVIGVAWVYGIRNFANDIDFMLSLAHPYWILSWAVLLPGFVTVLASAFILKQTEVSGPAWAKIIGSIFTGIIFLPIVVLAAVNYTTAEGDTIREKLICSIQPNSEYGPRLISDRKKWETYKKVTETRYSREELKLLFKCVRPERSSMVDLYREDDDVLS